jgi:hypothetical protein
MGMQSFGGGIYGTEVPYTGPQYDWQDSLAPAIAAFGGRQQELEARKYAEIQKAQEEEQKYKMAIDQARVQQGWVPPSSGTAWTAPQPSPQDAFSRTHEQLMAMQGGLRTPTPEVARNMAEEAVDKKLAGNFIWQQLAADPNTRNEAIEQRENMIAVQMGMKQDVVPPGPNPIVEAWRNMFNKKNKVNVLIKVPKAPVGYKQMDQSTWDSLDDSKKAEYSDFISKIGK